MNTAVSAGLTVVTVMFEWISSFLQVCYKDYRQTCGGMIPVFLILDLIGHGGCAFLQMDKFQLLTPL